MQRVLCAVCEEMWHIAVQYWLGCSGTICWLVSWVVTRVAGFMRRYEPITSKHDAYETKSSVTKTNSITSECCE